MQLLVLNRAADALLPRQLAHATGRFNVDLPGAQARGVRIDNLAAFLTPENGFGGWREGLGTGVNGDEKECSECGEMMRA